MDIRLTSDNVPEAQYLEIGRVPKNIHPSDLSGTWTHDNTNTML